MEEAEDRYVFGINLEAGFRTKVTHSAQGFCHITKAFRSFSCGAMCEALYGTLQVGSPIFNFRAALSSRVGSVFQQNKESSGLVTKP